MTTTVWPEGVIARYLTVGGATVDLICEGVKGICHGCGDEHYNSPSLPAPQWAQGHAAICRAMPIPNGAQQ